MSERCIFCDIVAGRAPAVVVLETTDVVCIVPLDVEVRGHTLVLPKAHYETLFDIPEPALHAVASAAKQLCAHFAAMLGATGANVLHASGRSAQQSVRHFHLHVLPRFDGDGIDAWPKLR